jgi:hypothetical protein
MSVRLPWTIAVVSSCGCAFFALAELKSVLPPSEDSSLDAPSEVAREIIKEVPVVREVIKEVPVIREVVKEVPAELSQADKMAQQIGYKIANAEYIDDDSALRGIQSIRVSVYLPDGLKDKISDSDLKDTIELELRRNGIPVSDQLGADYSLAYVVDGFWDDTKLRFTYTDNLTLSTTGYFFVDGTARRKNLRLWEKGNVGFAGSQKIAEAVKDSALSRVSQFSNRYLAKNPR